MDGLDLGPYATKILNALIHEGPYDLQALVTISNVTVGEVGRIKFALTPYRQKLDGRNIWHFVIGGLDFHLLTDQRAFPRAWAPYLANGNDPIIMAETDARDIRAVPMLQPIFARMLKR